MQLLRVLLIALWVPLVAVTVHALSSRGLAEAGAIFMGDLGHPWRAQFLTDFSMHVVLLIAWILYREKQLWIGLLCAAGAFMGGGAFSLAYIFVSTFRARGSMENLLLGWRARAA